MNRPSRASLLRGPHKRQWEAELATDPFSYDFIDSDETGAIYRKMLDADAERVLEWGRGRYAEDHPLEDLVSVWWLTKGPTAFRTGVDAVRYRRELLEAVVARAAGK